MKHFIPQVLIVMFVNLANSKEKDGSPRFGGYGEYANHPYQILGIIIVAFTLLIFVVGVLFPDLYSPFTFCLIFLHIVAFRPGKCSFSAFVRQSVMGKEVLSNGSAHLGSPSLLHSQHLIP